MRTFGCTSPYLQICILLTGFDDMVISYKSYYKVEINVHILTSHGKVVHVLLKILTYDLSTAKITKSR